MIRIISSITLLLFINSVIFTQSTNNINNINNTNNSYNKEATTTTAITIINQYPDYPATPGDVYDIYILTSINQDKTISGFVDTNYDIDLSFIGDVNVRGLKYTEVQDKLKTKIGNAYPGSIVNVVMRATGKFKITLLGEVTNAQIIDTKGVNTLSEVIENKTTPYASIRNIEIRSEDGSLNTYDLFKFQRYASKKNNPFLRPNDVITLRPYEKKISIQGEVKRPGTYELINGDSLYDVINIYGDGFNKNAVKTEIQIKRFTDIDGEYSDSTLFVNGETQELKNIKLHDGDQVTIKNRLDYISKVTIQGAISPKEEPTSDAGNSVSNRIPVTITSGSRVSTAIKDMNATFNLTSDLEKAFVLRDGEKIEINIKSILEQVSHEDDIILENKDIIIIPFRQLKVFVAGSVNKAGTVPFIENRNARYYIGLAGGFNLKENFFRSYSIRNVYGEKVKGNSIIQPEDAIWVNKDHPIAYLEEYAGYITAIITTFFVVKGMYDLGSAIAESDSAAINAQKP